MPAPVSLRPALRYSPVREPRGLSRFKRRTCYLLAFAVGYVVYPFLGSYGLGCLLLLLVPAVCAVGVSRIVTDLRHARAVFRAQCTPPGLRRSRRA